MPRIEPMPPLTGLMLEARRVVEGMYSGGHASPWRGPGHEFHDYRPFVGGDDAGGVDWKLWGRTDRLYVKRFRQRTDLHVTLMVDATASMRFAGLDRRGRAITASVSGRPTKLDRAVLLASAIAMIAVRQGDRAGLTVLGGSGRTRTLPPGGGWGQVQRITAALERLAESPPTARPGTDNLAADIRQAHAIERRRGVAAILSDLLDEPGPLLDAVARLRHDGFDVALLQVLTPEELDLGEAGNHRLNLVDPETRRSVSTATAAVASRYRRLVSEHVRALHMGCEALGADHVMMPTDEPASDALRRWLARRSKS